MKPWFGEIAGGVSSDEADVILKGPNTLAVRTDRPVIEMNVVWEEQPAGASSN